MENKLVVSSSPHIRSEFSTQRIMRDVLIALLPASLYGVYLFGWRAAAILVISFATAVATEVVCQKIRRIPVTINDYSAAVTGLLLGMNLPPSVPLWIPIVGSVFAIAVVKQAFGGLGHNFVNPALAARAFLVASWTNLMAPSAWQMPLRYDVAVTAATPLGVVKAGEQVTNLMDIVLGNVGGCIGETSAILLLLGGLYLVFRGVIGIRIPAMIFATAGICTFLFSGFDFTAVAIHLLSGGMFIGAIFMATDYASSPMNAKAQVVYAIGIGLIVTIIRFYGAYPEGMSYSILVMNVAAPLIDKFMKTRVFGTAKKGGKK